MKKTILIDGNNLMHKVYGSSDNHNAIISSVKSLIGIKYNVIFFFDGYGKLNDKNAVFSFDKTADEIMKKYIEKNNKPENLIVVTSDIEIASFAKICKCEIKSSSAFWKEINSKHLTKSKNINQNLNYDENEKPTGISKKDLDTFRKLFG